MARIPAILAIVVVAIRAPAQESTLLRRGRELYAQGRYELAADALERARLMGTATPGDMALLGFAYMRIDRLAEAERALEQALAEGPSDAIVRLACGQLAFLRIDYGTRRASPRYEIARTIDGGLSRVATANASWQTEAPVVLQRAEAGGQLIYSTTGGGSVLLDEKKWNLSLATVPALRMNLNGGYQGSFRREPPSEIWNQQATVSLTHEPHPLLSYKAAFALSDFAANTDYDLLKHETSGAVYLKPRWGDRVGTLGLMETFSVDDGRTDTEQLSKASVLMALPVTRAARVGHQLDWEWVKRTEPDEGQGNMLRHEGNVSFAGERLPLSASARYAFAHGYRGPRHDAATQIVVPLGKGYEARTTFTLSHYEQDDDTINPFLFELELSQSF